MNLLNQQSSNSLSKANINLEYVLKTVFQLEFLKLRFLIDQLNPS